jgi:hypothetical protein
MGLRLGHFGKKKMKNPWNFLECGAGEEWRKSVGPTM